MTGVTTGDEGGIPEIERESDIYEGISEREKAYPPPQESSLPSLPSPNLCPKCGIEIDYFYGKIHISQCDGTTDY